MKKIIALIDADGILFAEACSSETRFKGQDDDGRDLFLPTKLPEQAYEEVCQRFEDLILKVGADSAILCISDRENFRYGVLPSYKGNRVDSRRPPMLATLRELLTERKPWPVMFVKGLEADDVCGIAAGTLSDETRETIICSPDKDLRTIPGKLFACRNDSTVEEITEEAADRFHLFQVLTGDVVDNYTGCPKIGKVKAEAILKETDSMSPADRWARIVAEFEKRGVDANYALTQARVARILRSQDWDSETREIKLWEPPLKE